MSLLSALVLLLSQSNAQKKLKQQCLDIDLLPGNVSLTDQEFARLQTEACVTQDALTLQLNKISGPQNGIPFGVDCEAVEWCDYYNTCTTVCKSGSVVLSNWFNFAVRTQIQLSYTQSLCYQTLLGTHNSAITLAYGYGNEDPYFEKYLKYIKWISWNKEDQRFATNNQIFGLTDQLNMGVRVVETDVHWVDGALRIAHCGGLHVPLFDDMIRLVNIIAKALGHPLQWDIETLGCSPSLSSIPSNQQKYFIDALKEIANWLNSTANADQFLVLFLDSQVDIRTWGKLPILLNQIDEAFPLEWIMTPPEKNALFPGIWPSIDTLQRLGKRLIIVGDADWGVQMTSRVFYRNGPHLCEWTEPQLGRFVGPPQCEFMRPKSYSEESNRTLEGVFYRLNNCDLRYGPFNCEFELFEDNLPGESNQIMPAISDCSVNVASPDLLTPQLAMSYIWSWAPQQPNLSQGDCVVINSEDGRWYSKNCSISKDDVIIPAQPIGACPEGYLFDVPRNGKENLFLKYLMQQMNVHQAWLPIFAPVWNLPNTIYGSIPVQ